MRKDYDGDGVSDYWEFAILGTRPDDSTSFPDLSKPSVPDFSLIPRIGILSEVQVNMAVTLQVG